MLRQFVASNLPELITRCRTNVATRSMPSEIPDSSLDHGIPLGARPGQASNSA